MKSRGPAGGAGRALFVGLVCLGLFSGPARGDEPVRPYRRSGEEPLAFRGPGRGSAVPGGERITLGWFGPGDHEHPEYGEFWRGAVLALEEENAEGGVLGRALHLVPVWSESPWKAGISALVRLVYEQHPWAVIGGVDGTTTHLAVQVALKSHFLLLSPGSTDVTADHANVPWLFSLPPSDEAIAALLAQRLESRGGRFAVVAATDHDSHATLVAVRQALSRRVLGPAALLEIRREDADLASVAALLIAARPRGVLVLAPPVLAGEVSASLRRAGYAGEILGGSTLALEAFRRSAGEAAEGVVAPCRIDRTAAGWEGFAARYRGRWQASPDAAAVQGYDAIRMTAAAVRKAGLDRVRIREAVRELAPWPGVAGPVEWDALGRNRSPARLRAWSGGALGGR